MMVDLPALDDQSVRELNTKRIVESVENIGEHFKELKQQNRIGFIIRTITGVFLLILLGSIFYASFTIKGSSFMENMIDKDMMAQRYNCTYENNSAMFRSINLVKDFKTVYPAAECRYRDVRKEDNK